MSEMIERVARAICVADGEDPDYVRTDWVRWSEYLEQARAAIAAMREPTDRMLDAAAREAALICTEPRDAPRAPEESRSVDNQMFQAMIDEALR